MKKTTKIFTARFLEPQSTQRKQSIKIKNNVILCLTRNPQVRKISDINHNAVLCDLGVFAVKYSLIKLVSKNSPYE